MLIYEISTSFLFYHRSYLLATVTHSEKTSTRDDFSERETLPVHLSYQTDASSRAFHLNFELLSWMIELKQTGVQSLVELSTQKFSLMKCASCTRNERTFPWRRENARQRAGVRFLIYLHVYPTNSNACNNIPMFTEHTLRKGSMSCFLGSMYRRSYYRIDTFSLTTHVLWHACLN